MSSKGPDLLFALNEKFINSSLEMAYLQKLFPNEFSGVYILDVPEIFGKLNEINYKFTLQKSPIVDAIESSELKVLIKFLCELKWGLQFTTVFDAEAELVANPVYSQKQKTIDLNIIDINLLSAQLKDSMKVPRFILETANSTIEDIIKQKTWLHYERIPLLPLVSSFDLPEMPQGKYPLPLYFSGIKIVNNNVILVGFNFETRESVIPSLDFSKDAGLALSVSEEAINKVLSHWWRYTTHSKSEKISGSLEVKHLDAFVNHLSNISFELGSKLASLGFIESDFNIDRVWIEYDGIIKINEPSISLNQIDFNVTGKVEVVFNAVLMMDIKLESRFDTSSIIPDRFTPWKDDRTLGTKKRTITVQKIQSKRIIVDLSNTKAGVKVSKEGSLSIELSEFDVGLNIDWRLPKLLKKRFETELEKTVLKNYPSLPISSDLLKQKIQGTELHYIIKLRGIAIKEDKLVIHSNIFYIGSSEDFLAHREK
jgi:hypothetical protein